MRALLIDIVNDLVCSYGAAAMPAGFPIEPYDLTRADMLAAVRKHQQLFYPPELRGAG